MTAANDNGTKFDEGKTKWSYLPYAELEQIVKVFEHGAEKYGRNNWKQGFAYSRLWNATMRHLVAFKCGENLDSSGHHHLAHAAASILMLLAHHNHQLGTDDRN